MIEKTIFACSTDNLRPALTGVFCQIMDDQYRMIATDGHRLVKIVNTDFVNPGFIREIIIPTKALNFVARNLPEEGVQQIVLSENHVLFELPNTKIYPNAKPFYHQQKPELLLLFLQYHFRQPFEMNHLV